jgi:hypothetical protein
MWWPRERSVPFPDIDLRPSVLKKALLLLCETEKEKNGIVGNIIILIGGNMQLRYLKAVSLTRHRA